MGKVIYFETYLAGTTFGDFQVHIKEFAKVGDELTLLWDEENKFDPCAVGVFCYKYLEPLEEDGIAYYGWIPSEMNQEICEDIQRGIEVKGVVLEKKRPDNEYNFWNVWIQVYKID